MIVGRDGCIKCGSISVSECSIWYVLASVFDISQHKTGKFAKITIVALGRVRVNIMLYFAKLYNDCVDKKNKTVCAGEFKCKKGCENCVGKIFLETYT